MSKLWAIFNTLQLISCLPLLNLKFPANVMTVQTEYQKILNLEIIPKETVYGWFFGSFEKTAPTGEQADAALSEAGISSNVLLNVALISLTVVVGLTLIVMLMLIKFPCWSKCHPTFKKYFTMVERKVMFSSIIRSLIQGYLFTAVGVCMSLKSITAKEEQMMLNLISTYITFAFLVFLPSVTIQFLQKNAHKLHTPDFKGRFGTLY